MLGTKQQNLLSLYVKMFLPKATVSQFCTKDKFRITSYIFGINFN